MTYAGIQMFMQKLNQLISCNDNPLINHLKIKHERCQFQLLYDDLDSMIQSLFIHQHQDCLQKLNDLKNRFIDAAEEAEYIVDLYLSLVHIGNSRHLHTYDLNDVRGSFKSVLSIFLSCVHIRNNQHFLTHPDFKPSLNLDDVRRSFKSIEVELMSIKMDSSATILVQLVPAPISFSRNSKNLLDEIVVGLDRDVELIRDKLVEDHKKVDVVSVVGMGGIGKTTLATKVFNDAYVKHHFHFRVWVTVSQTYDKRAVLIQILKSIDVKEGLEEASDSRLRELVHKKLMCQRYLIVIDDIWNVETWDNLKLFFPHDNNGSRILLTTRLIQVAKHANSVGLIHHLGYLNKERSWELLCLKVFRGNECPEWSFKPGMKIVENCHGLPLAVAVIAGILAKEAWREEFWVEIAEKTGSYIVDEENGCMEILGLSYNHLPHHLRECFLYVGCFPEDYEFQVRKLMWLWMAEGFVEEDGNRSLEDIAEGYLMDLIDRNLLITIKRKRSNEAVKACKVHDLLRELCLKKTKEERLILETERPIWSSSIITTPHVPVRKFINTSNPDLIHSSTQNLRTVLWFSGFGFLSDDIKYFRSFVLLRVLDLQKCKLEEFPCSMELLVHLRFLAIWKESRDFPSSICNLWNLQTLIYNTSYEGTILPSNISNLVNLRHLHTSNSPFDFDSIEKPMNLQTISRVELKDKAHSFQKYFPCIKKLRCTTISDKQNDFKSLAYLERLSLCSYPWPGKKHITFPETLKTLALERCDLPWSDMSIIQSLPNLQVLKLDKDSFKGSCWNTDGQVFQQLKYLRLAGVGIKQWKANSKSFPCLKRLEIFRCFILEEISLEVGDIPTLEYIVIDRFCTYSLSECVRRIEEEQQDMGNYNLKIYGNYHIKSNKISETTTSRRAT